MVVYLNHLALAVQVWKVRSSSDVYHEERTFNVPLAVTKEHLLTKPARVGANYCNSANVLPQR